MSQRHTAATTTTSGTKPGSRRKAPPSTRNIKRAKIQEIIDLEPVAHDTDPVPQSTAPSVSQYSRQRQTETRPVAVAVRKQNMFHQPTATALR
uniref:Uncharacterized protein n=1 Tax=Panagrolaimus sp. ES5 TaxID=591445 RepID=A0AC34G7F8_9BILA